jgi:hypothetical protein
MSLAAEAREAARAEPFLHRALEAGVVNYRAAAAYLDLDGDPDAVATALRRYAEELDPPTARAVGAPVRMQSGVGLAGTDTDTGGDPKTTGGTAEDGPGADSGSDAESEPGEVVVAVGDRRVVRGGDMTAVRADGEVDAAALAHVLARLRATSVLVDAAGVVDGELVVVVPRRQGATALRTVEEALEAVPA